MKIEIETDGSPGSLNIWIDGRKVKYCKEARMVDTASGCIIEVAVQDRGRDPLNGFSYKLTPEDNSKFGYESIQEMFDCLEKDMYIDKLKERYKGNLISFKKESIRKK